MLRYKTETRPGLVAMYDVRPGNGAGPFLFLTTPEPARGAYNGENVKAELETSSCRRAAATICHRPSPHSVGAEAPKRRRAHRNVAVVSHAQYVPTLTAAAA